MDAAARWHSEGGEPELQLDVVGVAEHDHGSDRCVGDRCERHAASTELGPPRLEWSADCDDGVACRSPDAPSFVFDITSTKSRAPVRRVVLPSIRLTHGAV